MQGKTKTIFYSIRSEIPQYNRDELPMKYNNRERNYQHFLSRSALAELITTDSSLIDLELENYQFLKQAKKSIFSLAHTKKLAMAIKGEKNLFKSIGCDIEYLGRKVPSDATHHYMNDQDISHTSDLYNWCLKEACFKALSNLGKEVTLLKNVVLTENSFHLLGEEVNPLNRFVHFKYEDKNHGHFLVVIAYCMYEDSELQFCKR